MCKGTEHWEEPGLRGVSAARLGEEPRESSEVKGSGFSSVGAIVLSTSSRHKGLGRGPMGNIRDFMVRTRLGA